MHVYTQGLREILAAPVAIWVRSSSCNYASTSLVASVPRVSHVLRAQRKNERWQFWSSEITYTSGGSGVTRRFLS